LLNSLQQLNKAIPPRSTLPILSSVLFESKDGALELRTTDLEITITINIPVASQTDGSITIPISKLLEITNEMPDGLMDFEISDIGKVIIKSKYGTYTIMGEASDNFPAKPAIVDPKEVSLAGDMLLDIINKTTYAVSKEEIKPALQGVFFQLEKDSLRTVATDGHRLVRFINKEVNTNGFLGDVIIPAKFLSIIRNHLAGRDDVKLFVDENHVSVSLDETNIATRIIDQKYPDYENVIPSDNDKKILIGKDEILASVKRVSIFSNKSTRQIMLSVNENEITVSTEDPENVTTGKETIVGEYSGDPITISYNASYLKEVLLHQKTERILIKLKTPVSAGIFTPHESEEDIITLLMPIR